MVVCALSFFFIFGSQQCSVKKPSILLELKAATLYSSIKSLSSFDIFPFELLGLSHGKLI